MTLQIDIPAEAGDEEPAIYRDEETGKPITTQSMIKTFRASPREAFLLKKVAPYLIVNEVTGCWEWQRSKTRDGYGQVYNPELKRPQVVHKVIWEALNGPVPEGMKLDHECQVRNCANPYPPHQRVSSHAQNEQYREPSKMVKKHADLPSNVKRHSNPGRTRPYYARVTAFGKHYQSGYYATIAEAEQAAIALRLEHHKEYAS